MPTQAPKKRTRTRLGRPPGKTFGATIPLRLTLEQARAVATFARSQRMSKNAAIRFLLTCALEATPGDKRIC